MVPDWLLKRCARKVAVLTQNAGKVRASLRLHVPKVLPGPGCEGPVADFQQFFYVDAALLEVVHEAADILLEIWNQPARCHCRRYIAQSSPDVVQSILDGQQICLELQNANMELHDVIERRHGAVHPVLGSSNQSGLTGTAVSG